MVKMGLPGIRQRGMIYLALLLAIALIGGLSAVGLKVAQSVQLLQAEAELIAIGSEFSRALQSYADATPNGFPKTPENLAELLRDPRNPGIQRHLRQLYHDPLTGKAEWGVVRDPERRIIGIHSLSSGLAIKIANFPTGLMVTEGGSRHRDWTFYATGQQGLPPEQR